MNLHFCKGSLADWSFWNKNEKKTCIKCGMEKKDSSSKGCCKDEHKWIKIQDDQKVNFLSTDFSNLQPAEAVHFYSNQPFYFLNSVALVSQNNALLRSSVVPIYKYNCVFRI